MPGQPDDEAARIAADHLPRLTNVEQAIIAARCRNRSAEDIGKLVGLSKRQVERIVTRLTDLITIPLGYDPHGWLPGEWSFVHAGCCVADGRQRVRRAGLMAENMSQTKAGETATRGSRNGIIRQSIGGLDGHRNDE